ncbi:MAG: helix-turn-helix transcriptional regulator [Polyangiaceae bacterium]
MTPSAARCIVADVPTFGDRLRDLRESRGLSIGEASGRCGMNRSTWHHYESGKRPNPTLAVVAAMARALEVEPHELLDGVDEYPGD